ncbi:NB-ARC domain protein [Actinobacteria bacterium OV320]|nr:NB-ARC domain protein [Actinobacteria bacterium OV320]
MGGDLVAAEGDYVHGDKHVYPAPDTPAPTALRALPEAPAALVGRETLVDELLSVLSPNGPGVTVVAGLPGVGKSALTLTVAHQAAKRGWFDGGVLFIDLRGYDPNGTVGLEQAVTVLMGELGIRDEDMPPTLDGRLALYRSELATRAERGQRVLIVADDAGEVAQVQPLIPPDDAHRLLVTSRNSLVAPGFPARLVKLEELSVAAAANLVSAMFLRIRPTDPRPGREPDALGEIARHCGCLPLALTVVGALLADDPGLPLASFAEQLADERTRLEKLTFDDGHGMPVGVRAAFELSYARLPAELARLLRLFTAHPGPDCHISFVALLYGEIGGVAEAYAEPAAMRALLAGLARTGLIAEQPTGSGRWRMHDLVRLYAAELADRHAEEDGYHQAVEKLFFFYGAMLRACDSHLQGQPDDPYHAIVPDADTALDWLDEERDGVMALGRLAAHQGQLDTMDGFTTFVQAYLYRRGLFQEAADLSRLAADEFRRVGDVQAENRALSDLSLALAESGNAEEGAALQEKVLESHPAADPVDKARGLVRLAAARLLAGRLDDAAAAAEEGIGLWRELGDRQSEGLAWNTLGTIRQAQERFQEAVTAHERAEVLLAEGGDTHAAAKVRRNRGTALRALGRHDEAIDVHRQALAMFEEFHDTLEVAESFNELADSLNAASRIRDAADARRMAAGGYRSGRAREDEARARVLLGLELAQLRDFADAAAAHERAGLLYQDVGDPGGEGWARGCLATALYESGRDEEARDAWLRSAAAYREAGQEQEAQLATTLYEKLGEHLAAKSTRRASRLLYTRLRNRFCGRGRPRGSGTPS